MTDQLTQAITLYTDLRRTGLSKAETKRRVFHQLPGFSDAIAASPSYRGRWGNAVHAIDSTLGPNGHSNSRHLDQPPLIPTAHPTQAIPAPFASAAELTCTLFTRWVDRQRRVHTGDHFTLSPKQLADLYHITTGRRVTSVSFVNPFLNSQSSRLRDAGWEFVIVNNSHETYTVQITALPRPPEPPAPEPEPDPPATPPLAPAPNGIDTRFFEEFNAFLAWRAQNA